MRNHYLHSFDGHKDKAHMVQFPRNYKGLFAKTKTKINKKGMDIMDDWMICDGLNGFIVSESTEIDTKQDEDDMEQMQRNIKDNRAGTRNSRRRSRNGSK